MKCVPETSAFMQCLGDPEFQLGLFALFACACVVAFITCTIYTIVSDWWFERQLARQARRAERNRK